MGNAAIAGIQAENARNATKPAQAPIEINPGSPQLQVSDLNGPPAPISPVAYTVQSGESLSGIRGASDPAAIGAIMQANGLTSSTIYPGEQLVFPSGGYTEGDVALGQAALNVDNQRIAALQASQSYGTGIQWMSAGEQEEMLDTFPNATYGTNAGAGSSTDVVGDYINMMNQVGSYAQAAISGGYAGFQAIPGKMDAAVASVWGDIKSGWAHVTSLNALAGDVLSLNNEISQLPEQLPQLPGEVQNWATGLGNRVEQDGAQLFNYLRNTPGTQIAYDAGYTLTSNAPMIAFAIGTDGFGEVADGGELVDVAAGPVSSTSRTLIGKSGYASVQEFSDAALLKYQGFVDDGYSLANDAWDNGLLAAPGNVSKNTVLGSYTDQFARDAMRQWLDSEGIAEGNGELIQINRYLRDPSNPESYRIPDVYIPGANQIYDATLANKTWATPQVRGFFNYSRGSNITIVRPTQIGGSYSVLPPW